MTRTEFWRRTTIVIGVMTLLFVGAFHVDASLQTGGVALTLVSCVALLPTLFINAWVLKLRQNSRGYPSILDEQISPFPSVFLATIASLSAAWSAAVALPMFLSSFLFQPSRLDAFGIALHSAFLVPTLAKQKKNPSSKEFSP